MNPFCSAFLNLKSKYECNQTSQVYKPAHPPHPPLRHNQQPALAEDLVVNTEINEGDPKGSRFAQASKQSGMFQIFSHNLNCSG